MSLHSTLLAFRLDRQRAVELEGATRRGRRPFAHEHLAWLRALLEAGGDVDGIAGDERAPLAWSAYDDRASVDPDAKSELSAEEHS